MGRLNGGDGDNRPPDGGGLPDLPPEWGPIVVPDDPAELAQEAAEIRRELRQVSRRRIWRRRLRFGRPGAGSPVEAALVIVGVAILATLTSLFALAWPPAPGPAISPTGAARTAPAPGAHTVPALDLVDAGGKAVPLRGLLPAVILVVDECACAELIAATAAAAPPEVTVAVVAATAPRLPSPRSPRVRALADPAGELRGLAPTPLRGTATVMLVSRAAGIVRTVPAASSVAPYEADLATLGTR